MENSALLFLPTSLSQLNKTSYKQNSILSCFVGLHVRYLIELHLYTAAPEISSGAWQVDQVVYGGPEVVCCW